MAATGQPQLDVQKHSDRPAVAVFLVGEKKRSDTSYVRPKSDSGRECSCSSGRRSELLSSLEASLKLIGCTHSKSSLFALASVVVFVFFFFLSLLFFKAVLTSKKHQATCCVWQTACAAPSRSTFLDWLYDYPTGYNYGSCASRRSQGSLVPSR